MSSQMTMGLAGNGNTTAAQPGVNWGSSTSQTMNSVMTTGQQQQQQQNRLSGNGHSLEGMSYANRDGAPNNVGIGYSGSMARAPSSSNHANMQQQTMNSAGSTMMYSSQAGNSNSATGTNYVNGSSALNNAGSEATASLSSNNTAGMMNQQQSMNSAPGSSTMSALAGQQQAGGTQPQQPGSRNAAASSMLSLYNNGMAIGGMSFGGTPGAAGAPTMIGAPAGYPGSMPAASISSQGNKQGNNQVSKQGDKQGDKQGNKKVNKQVNAKSAKTGGGKKTKQIPPIVPVGNNKGNPSGKSTAKSTDAVLHPPSKKKTAKAKTSAAGKAAKSRLAAKPKYEPDLKPKLDVKPIPSPVSALVKAAALASASGQFTTKEQAKGNSKLAMPAVSTPPKPKIDTTSTEYLRGLLTAKSKSKSQNIILKSSPNTHRPAPPPTPKEVTIPSTFSPSHAYRAAAAYSLLRTLSNELRLSPFTLQAFTNALMLPVPSKLLGEIHVRVLRVLFANEKDLGGSYSKVGDGGTEKLTRKKIVKGSKDASSDGQDKENATPARKVEEELITKRGGNNLYFLDPTTWPLFYQDYALATEDRFLECMGMLDDGSDDDEADGMEFINVKSVAMLPMEDIELDPRKKKSHPGFMSRRSRLDVGSMRQHHQKHGALAEWVIRCPAGPMGRRNQAGRFVCCPFHIQAAVRLFQRMSSVAAAKVHPAPTPNPITSAAKPKTPAVPSTGKKRGRPPKKKSSRSAKKKRPMRKAQKYNDSDDGSSTSEEEEESDDDFPSPSKKRPRSSPTSMAADPKMMRPRPQQAKVAVTTPGTAPKTTPNTTNPCRSTGIRGSRVLDIEVAQKVGPAKLASGDSGLLSPNKDPGSLLSEAPKLGSNVSGQAAPPVASKGLPNEPPAVVDLTNNSPVKPSPTGSVVKLPTVTSKTVVDLAGHKPLPQCQAGPPGQAVFLNPPTNAPRIVHQSKVHAGTMMATTPKPHMLPMNSPPPYRPMNPHAAQMMYNGHHAVVQPPPSFPPIVVSSVPLPLPDKDALVVSDTVTDSLNNFFAGRAPKTAIAAAVPEVDKSKMMECDESHDIFSTFGHHTSEDSADHLLKHMIPLRHLDEGVPYHHFSLSSKLTMLEFLLDELLQVPDISNEFALRHTTTHPLPSMYGLPPEPEEYEKMYNADECTICGVEGDLLCCDGCPGSFHRACIGMGERGRLPQGKWLCPECKVEDLSQMGPLGSERRPLVGWFTLGDLELPREPEPNPEEQQLQPGNSENNMIHHSTQQQLAVASITAQMTPAMSAVASDKHISTTATGAATTEAGPAIVSGGAMMNLSSAPPVHYPHGATTAMQAHQPLSAAIAIAHNVHSQMMLSQAFPPTSYASNGGQVVCHTQVQSMTSGNQTLCGHHSIYPTKEEVINQCKIPNDVEFLVSAGKVFARYRNTLEPFDPFNLASTTSPSSSTKESEPPLPSPDEMQSSEESNAPLTKAAPSLNEPVPPVPLTARQLEELFKLFGSKICLALPWLRLPFNPDKVFPQPDKASDKQGEDKIIKVETKAKDEGANIGTSGGQNVPSNAGAIVPMQKTLPNNIGSITQKDHHFSKLKDHQKSNREFLLANSELFNPFVYLNSYRRAPPVPIVKSHQGQGFFHPSIIISDMNLYPTKTSSLSSAVTDLTIERSWKPRIQYLDPIKSIRDKIVRLERSLSAGALLNVTWGCTNNTPITTTIASAWKSRVDHAMSIAQLAKLLVELMDVTTLRAFVPDWYKLNEGESPNEIGGGIGTRGSSSKTIDYSESHDTSKRSSTFGSVLLDENWNQKLESDRRKWERCPGNQILMLFNGYLEEVFKSGVPENKRGKVRKVQRVDSGVKKSAEVKSEEMSNNKMASNVSNNETGLADKLNVSVRDDKPSIEPQAMDVDGEDQILKQDPSLDKLAKTAPAKNNENVLNGRVIAGSCPDKPLDKVPESPGTPASFADSPFHQNNSSLSKPTVSMDESSPEPTVAKSPTRRRACGKCENCRQEDCRECPNCRDMKKYGGPDKLRQKCALRKTCPFIDSKNVAKTPASKQADKTPAKGKSSKKKKQRAKRDSVTPAMSSSRKRRSDRLNVIRQQLESLLGMSEEMTNDKVEKAIIELKLDKLERLLAEDEKAAGYWTIAGKMLFEPDGSLSRPIVKRLARNAGSVRAPSVTYDSKYEVGETNVCHHWRKRTLECTTYEGLLLSLRVLDAHMDKAVIASAGNIAERKANSNKSPTKTTTAVRCVQIDPATGFNEYFVVPTGKKRGCWHSEESIDLYSLVYFRMEQRAPHLEKRNQQLLLERQREEEQRKKKVQEEQEQRRKKLQQEQELRRKMLQQAQEQRRKEQEIRKKEKEQRKKEQEQRKKKLQEERASAKAAKAAKAAAKRKAQQLNKTPSAKKPKDAGLTNSRELEFQAAVKRHRDDTLRLLKLSAAKGESSVPLNKMAETRSKNLAMLKAANILVQKTGGKKVSENDLTAIIAKCESEAVQLYVVEMRKMRDMKNSLAQQQQVNKPKPTQQPQKPTAATTDFKAMASTQKPQPTQSSAAKVSRAPAAAQSSYSANTPLQQSGTILKPSSQPNSSAITHNTNSFMMGQPGNQAAAQMSNNWSPATTGTTASASFGVSNGTSKNKSIQAPAPYANTLMQLSTNANHSATSNSSNSFTLEQSTAHMSNNWPSSTSASVIGGSESLKQMPFQGRSNSEGRAYQPMQTAAATQSNDQQLSYQSLDNSSNGPIPKPHNVKLDLV